ncbi:MAG: hypothetical protein NTV43_15955 [Methylococcales bacterium]|nr:hypothetical protein [Methylococcales bacterium]
MKWSNEIDSAHSGEIIRLNNLLDTGKRFCLILAEYTLGEYRNTIIKELASHYPDQAIVSAAHSDDIVATLKATAATASVIHIIDTQCWFDDSNDYSLLHRLNQRREWLAQHVDRGLVIWLSVAQVSHFAHEAADLWAWRKALVNFCQAIEATPTQLVYQQYIDTDNSTLADKHQRLTEIQTYLASRTAYSLADALLWQEQARILRRMGDLDAALASTLQSLNINKAHNDKRATAVSYGDWADVLQARGAWDEALRIRREEQLPVYEALGDKRGIAVTKGKIADVLQSRGELDEALRIRREEQLPVYEALGDKHSIAVTMGKIADVLHARGEWDEALRIRCEVELPVYEALGDRREKAITMGKIAYVLQKRGEWDEALRIRRAEQLPVYEALGDKREKALTMGQIADVLQARGEWDEALRICREEELPVYVALGDKRSIAITKGKIAEVLQARGEWDEALRIRREEVLPVFEALGEKRLIAITMGYIADVLQVRGEWDEALRIRREEELPVYVALGDKLSLLIGQVELAQLLQTLNPQQHATEIRQLLTTALNSAIALQIPEQEIIKERLQALDPD